MENFSPDTNDGVYNVVAGFVSMFSFLNSSMSSAVQRYYSFELGKNGVEGAKVVYNASIRIHFILAIALFALTEPIGLWYLHNKMVLPVGRLHAAELIFHFSVISMFIDVIIAPYMAAVVSHEKMGFYAIIGVFDSLLKLGIAVALPFVIGDKLIWYGVLYLGITCINLICYIIYCKVTFEEVSIRLNVPRQMLKELLCFSSWSILGSFSYMLREQGVNLVLNSFFGTIVNAARGVANQVNAAIQGLINSIVAPSRPQVVQAYSQGELDRAWNITYSISKITCLFFYLMALPVCIEIKYILHVWLGDAIPEHTSMFIIIMLITNTFGTLVAPLSSIMFATGKLKFYQIISSASNLLSVPLAMIR